MRTLKFPLHGASVPWDDARLLYNVIASDAPGSLTHFLYTLLFGGFRVFGKQAVARSFRNASVLGDREWANSVLANSALSVGRESFIPSRLYQRLLMVPRAVREKDPQFNSETVATEYARFFCNGKDGAGLPSPEQELFTSIGRVLAKEFASWKDVAERVADGARAIDGVLEALGYPSAARTLEQRIAAIKPCVPAGTVAFDPDAPPAPDAPDAMCINLILARALFVGRREGFAGKEELTKFAQTFFTGDANHAGLAWLFGMGLIDYFKQASVDQCINDFGVPATHRQAVQAVLLAAGSIPDASGTFLGGKHYSPYRSSIGGMLGGWITNYCNRLFDLDAVLADDAEPLVFPLALLADEVFLAEIGISSKDILALAEQGLAERTRARAALSRLLGIVPSASKVDIEAVESFNSLVDSLAGLLSALKDRIGREIAKAEASSDWAAADLFRSYLFEAPKWIRRLDKLNRLDLSPIDPDAAIAEASERFNRLHDAMHIHYQRIVDWAVGTGESLSPLRRLAAREAQHSRKPEEQALRRCLDMIGRSARKCSAPTVRRVAEFFLSQNVFADHGHCNQYFHNRRGALYKFAFDKNPRQPFPIGTDVVARGEAILAAYGDFLRLLRREIMAETQLCLTRISDLYRLEYGHFATLLTGLPEKIPSSLALTEDIDVDFSLPQPIRLQLADQMVSSAVMRRIFNHYHLKLESLAAILLRERFFLRTKFQRAGENALLYAPSGVASWRAPDRLYLTQKPIGTVMRWLDSRNGGRCPIDAPAALSHFIGAGMGLNNPSVLAYLRQAPHDWHYPWPTGDEIKGIIYEKSTGFGKRRVRLSACRMVGDTAYKGVLDSMIIRPDLVSIGDVSILIDQEYEQRNIRNGEGRIEIAVAPVRQIVNVALPVQLRREKQAALSFRRYVAIDLGERGFGYAVFDADTHALTETGTIKIRSMRRLVADDRIGKRKVSRINKFRAAYDPAEKRRRQNIVGDFCHAINRLMWYYDAFPVFEYIPGGASVAVDKVYASVVERYLFSTTPTVNAARESYWCGASYWKHPTLKQFKFDKASGKRSAAIESLSLFPGTGVSSYGTSQTCSACGRNPIEATRAIRDVVGQNGTIAILEGGRVALGNGVIKVRFSAPAVERALYRARNQRTPLTTDAAAGAINVDDLIRLIRRNLRQAPASRQSRDTTQSMYQCLYENCWKSLHAEINAATNIGKRFASERPKVMAHAVDSGEST